MPSDFEQAIDKLEELDVEITLDLLEDLSGASRQESELFDNRFERLPEARRIQVMSYMVRYAEQDFRLEYNSLYRTGLEDENPTVRRLSIEGLWEDERLDLVRKLIKILENDDSPEVRAAAATSLGRFLYLAECEEIDERRGEMVRSALLQAVEAEDEPLEVKRRAIESLAYVNEQYVRRIIDEAYAHPDPRMRESALFAMGRSADRFWAETVLAELHNDAPAMRYEAVRACGELRLSGSVASLVRLISTERDGEVQSMAVWALGEIGGKRTREVLERLAEGENEALATAAQSALERVDFADPSFDLMVFDVEDSARVGDAEDADDDEESQYRQDFHRYVDEDADDDDDWPDEFLEID